MPNIVVVGTQWGDEGKGKVVDVLTPGIVMLVEYSLPYCVTWASPVRL